VPKSPDRSRLDREGYHRPRCRDPCGRGDPRWSPRHVPAGRPRETSRAPARDATRGGRRARASRRRHDIEGALMRTADRTGDQVRGALKIRGVTLKSVARAGRISRSSLPHAGRRSPNRRGERALARKLGLPLEMIYPSRLRADAFAGGGREVGRRAARHHALDARASLRALHAHARRGRGDREDVPDSMLGFAKLFYDRFLRIGLDLPGTPFSRTERTPTHSPSPARRSPSITNSSSAGLE